MSAADADTTAGYQSWRSLAFLHWRVPAETLQPLVPCELTIETFDGSAWIGVVPFSMERVRPWWSPPVPGVSWFLETNVRTYVRDSAGRSGVWFFSLDANSRLAVGIARRFWHLPYRYASLWLRRLVDDAGKSSRTRISYFGVSEDNGMAGYAIKLSVDESDLHAATPGSLEHFLVERYLLFAQLPDGRIRRGRVHHAPYRFAAATADVTGQDLLAAAGVPIAWEAKPDHVVWSPGVDVRVSQLIADS